MAHKIRDAIGPPESVRQRLPPKPFLGRALRNARASRSQASEPSGGRSDAAATYAGNRQRRHPREVTGTRMPAAATGGPRMSIVR